MISGIRRELLVRGRDGGAVRALDVAGRADLGWQDRLAILREHVLDRVPVLVLLDNFEDNLRPDGAGYAVGDEALGGLLAAWAADPGQSRLLVTCRYRFTLPGGGRAGAVVPAAGGAVAGRDDEAGLVAARPGPARTTPAGAGVAAGRRAPPVAGIPRRAAGRRHRPLPRRHRPPARRGHRPPGRGRPAASGWPPGTGLDAALAETVALAADDVLLDDLLTRLDQVPGAPGLLLGISVYREPVDDSAVLFQAGQPDPAAEHIPDRKAACQQITAILAAVGIPVDESFDLASVPGRRSGGAGAAPGRAAPPAGPAIPAAVRHGRAARGVPGGRPADPVDAGDEEARFFVHRWTATELAARAAASQRAAGAGAPAGGRLLAVAGPGLATGPGRRRA